MKRIQRAFCAVWILLLIAVGNSYAQNSNIGTEFWTGYMDHVYTNSGMVLYIASSVNTTGTVEFADGRTAAIPFTVAANVVTLVDIPGNQFLGDTPGISPNGIHITSQNPIAVYAHIYERSVSGATLLLPVNTLANDYYSLNFTQLSNSVGSDGKPSYSTFMVIATDDNTTVEITPSADLLADQSGSIRPAGQAFRVTLAKGELYQGLSNTDLTGTHITSVSTTTGGCKRIAVFSGSSKISIGLSPTILTGGGGSADNLFQQVYPTASWGKNFITVRLKARNYDIYRIVVSDPAAVVKLNGVVQTNLINNFYYEFPTQVITNVITSDKPIQVIQYAVTQGEKYDPATGLGTTTAPNDIGDPEMIYLNPLEQNIDHVTLYSTDRASINANLSFINVVIPTSAVSSFLIDGQVPATAFTAVSGNPAYSYGQFNVTKGATHNLAASQGFNAIAYGFGMHESYGYAAGTNVKNLNEYVQYVNPATNAVLATACTGVSLRPQIVLPYQTPKLIWDFGNNVTETVLLPVETRSFQSPTDASITLYQYNYSQPVNYTTAGTYNVKVTATDPITTVCGNDEDIYLSFTILAPSQAKFTAIDATCKLQPVTFTDQTDVSQNAVSIWKWDFGNGDISNSQNPTYTFNQAGDYNVTLTTTTASGCSTSYSKMIHIKELPIAKFNQPSPSCETPLSVTFTDISTSSEGIITSWLWDFGDGQTSTLQNPVHTYASAQSYPVTLTVTTDIGCSSTLTQNTVVNYAPVVDFDLPDACIADVSHFTTNASVADGSPLTIQWDFGDVASNVSTANPNTAFGPTVTHQYADVNTYNVTLTVTTVKGCVISVTKPFTVNGKFPVAAFDAPMSICSNKNVDFINQAHIPGFNGKVTSFVIDFGDGTAPVTYRIDQGQIFTHKYPTEYLSSQTYHVKMTAYSGASVDCTGTITQDITVEPVPKTIFDAPAKICQNASALQLADYALPTYGTAPTGKPVFEIDNIKSPDGVLNPIVLGTGRHSLTCYYTFDVTGCADTTRDTITIEPIASVKAGKDVTILLGQPTQLKPTVIGGGTNTFLWEPSAGLSDPTIEYPKASPLVNTTYKLTVTSTTDGLACPVSDSLKITVLQPPTVPNTFTPNRDSNNDTWYIKDLNTYPGCTVEVYTRNGERVFYSVGYAIAWDGRYNGVNLPVGTYYYIIDPKNGRSKIAGYVTIIR